MNRTHPPGDDITFLIAIPKRITNVPHQLTSEPVPHTTCFCRAASACLSAFSKVSTLGTALASNRTSTDVLQMEHPPKMCMLALASTTQQPEFIPPEAACGDSQQHRPAVKMFCLGCALHGVQPDTKINNLLHQKEMRPALHPQAPAVLSGTVTVSVGFSHSSTAENKFDKERRRNN